ncbi:MAG TPA: ATP-dependent RecD-like DNA helicase [Desulfobacterales bacterium]
MPKREPQSPDTDFELSGQIEHITYTNEENGFTIARVRVPGRRDPVTVVGNILSPRPGEFLQMTGEWTRHPKYGPQFKIASYQLAVPATARGIERYLGSGMIRGLGPVMARRIVKHFGDETLEVIENDIERLTEVEGIGRKRVELIARAWQDQKEIRNVMIFLQDHGISTGYAAKIFRRYGQGAIVVVKENPYRLAADIDGIGFKVADRIAEKLGMPPDSPTRLTAGILYVLARLADEGHVYYPYEPLLEKCGEILSVSPEALKDAVGSLALADRIVIEDLNDGLTDDRENHESVYLKEFHVCETAIARRLRVLITAPKSIREVQVDSALQWVQQQLAVHLAEKQIEAVRAALVEKVLVITGGPGTGKTTIINAVLKIFARIGVRFFLAAPTGRAAKRMAEACGHESRTIHRMLEYNRVKGGFQKNDDNPLDCRLLVIDEASMIDTVLMHHLLKAVPPTTTLILVGDVNQLPSVGAGNVLRDVIESGAVRVTRLTEIFRQARRSQIVVNAHRINAGRLPELTPPVDDSDFFFIEQEDPEKVLDIILELVGRRIPNRFGFDPFTEVQVLTPMHRGVVGSGNLNDRLQETLNPGSDGISRGDRRFRVGDRVMQIKNNYDKDVFNGDIGRIEGIDPVDQTLRVNFDERPIAYEFSELDELVPAYAISVHKSQGSEYPAVVMPLLPQHYLLLQRNLIYTAVTRGRKLMVLVGARRALEIGVHNDSTQRRYTFLRSRLAQPSGGFKPR